MKSNIKKIAMFLLSLLFTFLALTVKAGVTESSTPAPQQQPAETTPGGNGIPGTCPTSGISASSGTTTLTSNCQVNGNVTLSGIATLSMTGAVLSIAGKVVMNDQAQLTITNGTLTFPQKLFGQYSLTLNNSAHLTLNNSKLVTSGTSRHLTMTWNAHNSSVVNVESSALSADGGNWLLGYFHDRSHLIMNNSTNLPTEVYPSDASQISISHSNLGDVVLEFMAGSVGTVNVPQRGKQGIDFDFGNSPGFNYSIHLVSTQGRLTLGSHPNSSMTVKGTGNVAELTPCNFHIILDGNTSPSHLSGFPVNGSYTPRNSPIRVTALLSLNSYLSRCNRRVVNICK